MQKNLEQLLEWKIEVTALWDSKTVEREKLGILQTKVEEQNAYLRAESAVIVNCEHELNTLVAQMKANQENQNYFNNHSRALTIQKRQNALVDLYEPKRITMKNIQKLVEELVTLQNDVRRVKDLKHQK